ncbi:VRR-NUC domain-containing protein [Embleya sp. NPDC059237]|uniref:VRR-NUC domain-containing protein n=1 Tax=Embleya sp. NPDC059237 TaxID=3346784 RepID=UPI003696B974
MTRPRRRLAAPDPNGPQAAGASITEEAFRRQVREVATHYGRTLKYHTHDARRSDPGWPDEVFGHPDQRRTVFVELKTQDGLLRPAQVTWLRHLHASGCEAALWRPVDMPHIVRVLGPVRERAVPPAHILAQERP